MSAYQALKLEPSIREMNNLFAEKMLRMYKIYQPYLERVKFLGESKINIKFFGR